MKKRTAVICGILSLIPFGQPLLIKTGVVLSSTGLMLTLPEKVNAESYDYYINLAQEKGVQEKWYEALFYLNMAIELRPYSGYAYWGRGTVKNILGDKSGACSDFKKAESIGEGIDKKKVKQLIINYNCWTKN